MESDWDIKLGTGWPQRKKERAELNSHLQKRARVVMWEHKSWAHPAPANRGGHLPGASSEKKKSKCGAPAKRVKRDKPKNKTHGRGREKKQRSGVGRVIKNKKSVSQKTREQE